MRFLYDGDALVGEYTLGNVLGNRYIHGPGVDEPLVWYTGTGVASRYVLRANHQGSIVTAASSRGRRCSSTAMTNMG